MYEKPTFCMALCMKIVKNIFNSSVVILNLFVFFSLYANNDSHNRLANNFQFGLQCVIYHFNFLDGYIFDTTCSTAVDGMIKKEQ